MTWPLLLALLWAVAALSAYRARLRPSLRRAAGALVLLAVADSVRFALAGPQSGEVARLDVALSLLWPTAAAWLIAGWPALAWAAYAVALALWGRHLAPWWGWALRAPRAAVAALATAATWARWGGQEEPAARRETRRNQGANGGLEGGHEGGAARRSWAPSERIGLLLAAGQTASVVTGLWVDWGDVRWISAAVYVMIGVAVLREPRAGA